MAYSAELKEYFKNNIFKYIKSKKARHMVYIQKKIEELDFYKVTDSVIRSLSGDDIVCCTERAFYFSSDLEKFDKKEQITIVVVEILNNLFCGNYLNNRGSDNQYYIDKYFVLSVYDLLPDGVSIEKIKALKNSVGRMDNDKLNDIKNRWIKPFKFEYLPKINETKIGSSIYYGWKEYGTVKLIANYGDYLILEWNTSEVSHDVFTLSMEYCSKSNKRLVVYDAVNNKALLYNDPISKQLIEDVESIRLFNTD